MVPRTALTPHLVSRPGRRACTVPGSGEAAAGRWVFPPVPAYRPYFKRMKSTLARGGPLHEGHGVRDISN